MSEGPPKDPSEQHPKVIDFKEAQERKERRKQPPPHMREPTLKELWEISKKVADEQAQEALEAVLENPDNIEALLKLGNLCSQTYRIKAAEWCLKRALQIKPNLAEACSELGLMYAATPGREREAIPYYRKAIKLRPKPEDYIRLADILKDTDPMEAIGLYSKFLENVDASEYEGAGDLGGKLYIDDVESAKEELAKLKKRMRIK